MGDEMKKGFEIFMTYALFVLFILPVGLSSLQAKQEEAVVPQTTTQAAESETQTEETVWSDAPLEEYLVGVVAAEMPALFEEEALKAQAVAARTYAVYQMESQGITVDDLMENGGQSYQSLAERQENWGESFSTYESRIRTAVEETAGEILVYEEEPILAVFHAISSGETESAENLWGGQDLPYLQSVASPQDETSLEYTYQHTFSLDEAAALLQQADPQLVLASGSLKEQMQVLSRSDAGYIQSIQIGNRTYTGQQIRTALGLRSTDFTVEENGDEITFTTYGYGHGAGMSQYGANALALEGYSYDDILHYYYTDVSLKKME